MPGYVEAMASLDSLQTFLDEFDEDEDEQEASAGDTSSASTTAPAVRSPLKLKKEASIEEVSAMEKYDSEYQDFYAS